MANTFNTEEERELDPREEKKATSGDICCPITVLVKLNLTLGFLRIKIFISKRVK